MRLLKFFPVMMVLLGVSQVKAQRFELKKPDNPARCSSIKEGRFVRVDYPAGIWNMTIKDNVQTEYFNNGKDYIKSSLVFLNDCSYKAIVIEKTALNDRIKVGDVFSNTITKTQDNYLQIQTRIGNSQIELIYAKAKSK
ncbi:hypothetical protein MP478_06775 [Chryseobacterium sp. WG14]|uniref:hypothetical protein n=1 Tax=Chryseobacterium sp. WG14 TaxID=2926909 RepID=UPI00211E518F|nr:hypothetical protein [Chryseobacterium sp. WG14]MCQ9639092.1 hypothetical protein [Chryseobacterium sp. WG14]